MIEFSGMALLRPWWLLALPLVAVLAYLFARRASMLAAWDRAVDPPLMRALERLGRVVPGRPRRNWLPAATAALVALALLGPASQADDIPTYRNLDGIVLALDLSKSVAEGGGLQQALTTARIIIAEAGTRPVALVVYGGDAYLASAFTTDGPALGTTVAVLDGETVPDPGSRPERALALARQSLEDARIVAGDVVLVSDGGGIGPAAIEAAEAIVAAGGTVSTIFVPADDAPRDMPAPNAAALASLAEAGGGMAGEAFDAVDVARMIGSRAASSLAAGDLAVLLWADYGRYLLVLALFPTLALFRRSA